MLKISAIIPAFNEAENISLVVQGLIRLRRTTGLPLIHEVIVADNASTDETATLAGYSGAKVIYVPEKGYGIACASACKDAQGDVLLFVDGDHTANLMQAQLLCGAIEQGFDMAIGVRTHAAPGSLSAPQRFGNWLACFLVRSIWQVPITDLGPFRAIRRTAYESIGMQDRAYGWTIEMQIRAAQLQLRTCELDVDWLPRHAGVSKVSGTVRGVIGAGWGILSMITRLWWRGQSQAHSIKPLVLPTSAAVLSTGQARLASSTKRRSFLNRSNS